jgi:hypothetical protein
MRSSVDSIGVASSVAVYVKSVTKSQLLVGFSGILP